MATESVQSEARETHELLPAHQSMGGRRLVHVLHPAVRASAVAASSRSDVAERDRGIV